MTERVLFSRGGSTHPLGKFDDEIRVDFHSSVRDVIRSKASEAGIGESEFVRLILYSHAYGGYDEYERTCNERNRAALGLAPSSSSDKRTG
jgi:hypothetical protein